jgi:putative hydroxymethylpyrimidine transport system substrate-binding protein
MAGSPSDIPIVSAMVTHDGGSMDRVRMVNVGYNLLLALLTKRVDAVVGVYWTWEAIQAREKGHPVTVMRVEKWGVPNYCELVLVANEKTVQTRKAYVRGVVRALQKGYAYAEAHPDAAWQALQGKASGLNRRLVVSSLKLLAPVVTGAPTVGYQNTHQWQQYTSWLTTNKLIDAPVNARAAFTNQFLQPGVR